MRARPGCTKAGAARKISQSYIFNTFFARQNIPRKTFCRDFLSHKKMDTEYKNLCPFYFCILQRRRLWQRKNKLRSDTLRTDHINIFSMRLDDLLDDRQSESRSFLIFTS